MGVNVVGGFMGLSLSVAEAHFGSIDRGFHVALSWCRAACAPWGLEPGVGVNAVAPATPVRGTSSFQPGVCSGWAASPDLHRLTWESP